MRKNKKDKPSYLRKRKDWGDTNPRTRIEKNKKKYDRKRHKRHDKYEYGEEDDDCVRVGCAELVNIVSGRIASATYPFLYNLLDDLIQHGWKKITPSETHLKKHEVVAKRFGMETVYVYGDGYGDFITIAARMSSKHQYDDWDNYNKNWIRHLDVDKINDVNDVVVVAKHLVSNIKKYRQPRKKTDYDSFVYNKQYGMSAYQDWVADVRKEVVKLLKQRMNSYDSDEHYGYTPTSLIYNVLLGSGGIELGHATNLNKQETKKEMSKILNLMVKHHEIIKDKNFQQGVVSWKIKK